MIYNVKYIGVDQLNRSNEYNYEYNLKRYCVNMKWLPPLSTFKLIGYCIGQSWNYIKYYIKCLTLQTRLY